MYKGALTITQIILNKEETMPRTKNSKVKSKKMQQHSRMLLQEIAHCILIDYKTVNGYPMLIYHKISDETIECCLLDSNINFSSIKRLLKDQKKTENYSRYWLSTWKELEPNSERPVADILINRILIKNITSSLTELVKELADMGRIDVNITEKEMTEPELTEEDDIPF